MSSLGASAADRSLLPYLLDDEAIAGCIEGRLGILLAPLLAIVQHPLRVQVIPPDDEGAERCRRHNLALRAELIVEREGSPQVLRAGFPFPWHGVFLFPQDDADEAAAFTWRPHLLHRPGLWRLRRYDGGVASELYRYVFLDGTYVERTAKQLHRWRRVPSPKRRGRAAVKLLAEVLHAAEPGQFCRLTHARHPQPLRDFLRNAVVEAGEISVFDEQDLAAQRLLTYAHFLLLRFFQTLYECLVAAGPRIAAGLVLAAEPMSPDDRAGRDLEPIDPDGVWKYLCEHPAWRRLVPGRRSLLRQGLIAPFHPINGVDALSQLTALEKFGFRSEVIESLPGRFRQNHPSYRGWICPVESPETKRVGTSLHLARGVETDILGRLRRPAGTVQPGDELGYAAALVPFYQHNDGARAMMGAKNLKQAVPVRGAEAPRVSTGAEAEVMSLLEPLRGAGLVPDSASPTPGVDLLVGYLPFFGWNYEDAIVANRRLAAEGVLDWEYALEYAEYLRPGLELSAPLEPLPRPIGMNEPVAVFRDTRTARECPVPGRAEWGGQLLSATYHQPSSPLFGGKLVWRIGYRRPLVVGDKLMGRYGNKGVISQLRVPGQMPRLPDDPRLPEHLRGRAVDLVLNPMGVISRMNLGQLLEAQVGLLKSLEVPGSWDEPGAAGAFRPLDLDELQRGFQGLGGGEGQPAPVIDVSGRIRLTIPLPEGGETETQCPVVVGFQHFVRLRHHPPLKAQVRAGRGPHDRYLLQTGQPVAGRRNLGGQRLGEMEIWAFAAHRARHNLAAILGYKSDPALPVPAWETAADQPAATCIESDPSAQAAPEPLPTSALDERRTFASIRDHLYGLGIALQEDPPGTYRLSWIEDGKLKFEGKRIEKADAWLWLRRGRFKCRKCDYVLPAPIEATGKTKRSGGKPDPTVGDLLRSQGKTLGAATPVTLERPAARQTLVRKEQWPLQDPQGEHSGDLALEIHVTRRQVTLSFAVSGTWYGAQTQLDAEEVKITREFLSAVRLTCLQHKNVVLYSDGQELFPHPVTDGLCDSALVGTTDLTDRSRPPWGYIERAESVAFPQLGRREIINRPKRSLIPVMPLRYRFQSPASWPPDALNEAYKGLLDPGGNAVRRDPKKDPVRQISNLVADRLFGKLGLIRRQGLGRRVDFSGRFVIVPDPEMAWNECGVSLAALAMLLGPEIAPSPWLERFRALESERWVRDGTDVGTQDGQPWDALANPDFWRRLWFRDEPRPSPRLDLAYRVLRAWLDDRPGFRVILNRQPSLHRYNLMAFRPRPLPAEDGKVLRIHPLVCKGFGADFDGDEMSLHLPMSDEEHTEAARLEPTRNLLSVADGQPVAGFDQDFVLGHFLLSGSPEGRSRLVELLGADGCRLCGSLFEEHHPWGQAHGAKVMRHLCEAHPDASPDLVPAWMRLCFREATLAGISFGALDALACHIDGSAMPAAPDVRDLVSLGEAGNGFNNSLDALAVTALKEQMPPQGDLGGGCSSDSGLAAIALSKARGDKQVRQILAARGVLLPGEIDFGLDAERAHRLIIKSSLLKGMSPEEAFWAAMNARSSMIDKKLATPKAGYLTRKLVLALWGWRLVAGDCGSTDEQRSLVSCLKGEPERVCARCYGEVAGIGQPVEGWPIGLLAAQSFGERGTQLSMQSFHTSKKAMSIEEVDRLLEGKVTPDGGEEVGGYFSDGKGLDLFVQRLREISAYARIDERHLQLIWLAIHRSKAKSLSGVWEDRRGPLSSLAGPGQLSALIEALDADTGRADALPFCRVLMGQPPV